MTAPSPVPPSSAPPLTPEQHGTALVLVAAPQRAERLLTLTSTALHAFYAWSEEAAERCATDLIHSLLEKGWLERAGLELVPTRDDVVDEVLEGVLRQQQAPRVRRSTLFCLLTVGLQSPQTLGRLMTSLRRLVEREPAGNPFEQEVLEALDLWFERHSVEMGRALLEEASEDVSSYALGAVGSGHLGGQLLARHWEALLRPWLERSGNTREARHLFHRCLQGMPPGEPVTQALLTAALRWLDLHGGCEEASFVLGPLLWREDLGERAPACLQRTLRWLELHAEKDDALHLLSPLLMTPEQRGAPPIPWSRMLLEGQNDRRLVEFASRWLASHDRTLQAGPLLWKLLRGGPLAEGAASCLPHAMRWLEVNHLVSGASYILRSLLKRAEPEEHASVCIEYALGWLDMHGRGEQASFVLSALLCRDDLEEARGPCHAHARRWLEAHPDAPDAFFISRFLLLHSPGREEPQAQARSIGRWLQEHGDRPGAAVLVRHLLTYKKFEPLVGRCEEPLSRWLKAHAQTPEAGVFLGVLLRGRQEAGPRLASEQVVRWLELHGERLEAGPLLGALMARRRGAGFVKDRMARVLRWMERHGQHPAAVPLIRTLLRRRPEGPLLQACLEWSARWMEAHARRPEALTLSSALALHLKPSEVPESLFNHMVRSLELHARQEEAQTVLSFAFVRAGPGAASALIPLALDWLDANGMTKRAWVVLQGLVRRKEFAENLEGWLVDVLRCMRGQLQHPLVPTLLAALLDRADLREPAREPVVELARSWLATQSPLAAPSKRVRECLERTVLPAPEPVSA